MNCRERKLTPIPLGVLGVNVSKVGYGKFHELLRTLAGMEGSREGVARATQGNQLALVAAEADDATLC